ncbi:MAG: septum formation initiator family protein [bacterium]
MLEQGAKIKKILGSRMTLFLLLLAFLWVGQHSVNIYYKKYKIAREINDLKAEIAKTEKSNQEISAMIDYLGSQDFLEKQAREKLNMKREGEQVVIVEPAKEAATTSFEFAAMGGGGGTQENAEIEEQRESNFAKWWKYFFR